MSGKLLRYITSKKKSASYTGYGIYGKLPSVGDFIHRNLSYQVISTLDTWLQSGMHAISAYDNEHACPYLVAPVWKFLLPAGVLDEYPRAGLIMASADSIGRYFPLVIISHQSMETPATLAQLCSELTCLGRFLPSVLQEKTTPDQLLVQINTMKFQPQDYSIGNIDLNFNTQGQESLWWAQNQKELRTHITHKSPLDKNLFKKLFLETPVYF